MSFLDLVLICMIGAALTAAVRHVIKNRRSGRCTGCCDGCPGCSRH